MGPMFMDPETFVGSWGHNFLGDWFFESQCKTIHYFVKHSWECNYSWVTHEILELYSPSYKLVLGRA